MMMHALYGYCSLLVLVMSKSEEMPIAIIIVLLCFEGSGCNNLLSSPSFAKMVTYNTVKQSRRKSEVDI